MVSNFEVQRDGKTVKIWLNSGAEVENCMLGFSYQCATEIEADLLRQKIEESIHDDFVEAWAVGEKAGFERGCVTALKEMEDATTEDILAIHAEAYAKRMIEASKDIPF